MVEVLHFERLGEGGVGLVPLAELQEGDRQVDRPRRRASWRRPVRRAWAAAERAASTAPAQVAGPGEDVGQVELRSGQVAVVPGPLGQAGGLSQVSGGLDHAVGERGAEALGDEAQRQVVAADVEGLAEGERLGGEPFTVGSVAAEGVEGGQVVEGGDRVLVRVGPEHLEGCGELGPGGALASGPPEGVALQGLGPGCAADVAELEIALTGGVGVGDGCFEVSVVEARLRGSSRRARQPGR